MTCIVGVKENKNVWIGADSAGVSGLDIISRADQKVFINGPFIMGFTTSFRMGQLLRYAFKPPKQKKGVDDYKYMATTFIDAIRKCLKDGGFASKKCDVETGGEFIVGYKGELYTIYNDYQVAKSANAFTSVGCGQSFALGALHILDIFRGNDLSAENRITWALETAAKFSAGVRGPFHILSKK